MNEDKLGAKAYRVRQISELHDDSDSDDGEIVKLVSKLCMESDLVADSGDELEDDDDDETFDGSDGLSHMASPVPDDTNCKKLI